MKTWLIIVSVLCLLAMVILSSVNISAPADSTDCSICDHLKCHAPCILNLETGEIAELDLYIPHEHKVGEIAEDQIGGTFSVVQKEGLKGSKQTDPWYIELEVPVVKNRKRTTTFCNSCCKQLEECKYDFALLDLYDLENPTVYKIEEGVSYDMRCYKISISKDTEKGCFVLRIDGVL